ncbi:lipase family protein [Gordonia terrae]
MRRGRRRARTAIVRLAALSLAAALGTGCGSASDAEEPSDSVAQVSVSTPTPRLSDDVLRQRGTVVSVTDAPEPWLAALPSGTTAQRIVYRSASGINGFPTEVSGAVFVPTGPPPPGGRPLIAYAHGTTGITRDCGPSDDDAMFGDLTAVNDFLTAGYAVVTTDYQGLGNRPARQRPHPYLEPRTAAYNVIDAVRAVQSTVTVTGIGPSWAAVGRSQGGAAAWSTAEEYGAYGAGVGDLVGAVAVAPLLDAGYFVTRAQEGSLTRAQQHLYPLVVHGAAQVDDEIIPGDHLSASGMQAVPTCSDGRTALAASSILDDATLSAVTPTAAQRIFGLLNGYALPRATTTVPILAVYGGADDLIPVDIMENTLARACNLGDRVVRIRHDQQGHTVDPGPVMASWIRDRFSNVPAPGDC